MGIWPRLGPRLAGMGEKLNFQGNTRVRAGYTCHCVGDGRASKGDQKGRVGIHCGSAAAAPGKGVWVRSSRGVMSKWGMVVLYRITSPL